MDIHSKPRLNKEEVQRIIDDRLAVILEKELQQQKEASKNGADTKSDSSKK